jgi:DNA polymerase III delta prime subunit
MPLLYHGPASKEHIPEGTTYYLLDSIETIKLFVSSIQEAGICNKTYAIGPIDEISDRAADALLKTLEELDSNITLYLWCCNIQAVKKTLISRCQIRWFGSQELYTAEEKAAGDLIKSATSLAQIIKVSLQKDLNLKKSLEYCLKTDPSLWVYVKYLFKYETILPSEFISALGKKWAH